MSASTDALEDALRTHEAAFGEALSSEARASLASFVAFVDEWNQKFDLTAAKGAEQLVEVFCADALVLRDEQFLPRGARVLDIGTGAGGPAVALLLLRPDLRAVLLEPLKKRTTFLREAIARHPGLAERVEVRDGRIDTSKPIVEGAPFDAVMSRATFAPPQWLKIGRKLGDRVVVFLAREAVDKLPPPNAERRYELPRTGAPRSIRVYAR